MVPSLLPASRMKSERMAKDLVNNDDFIGEGDIEFIGDENGVI